MTKQKSDTERLAEALDRTPANADRALREAITTARAVRATPRPALSKAAHARIERRALEKFRARSRRARRPVQFSFAQWAIASAVVLALIVASTGTVAASASSLPGETLYPVKRFVEGAQLVLASEDKRPALHIAFAETRLSEIESLAAEGDIPPGLVQDLATETEAALTGALSVPVEQQAETYAAIVSMTEHQQEVLARVLAKAPEPAQAALAHAQSVSAKGNKAALEALGKLGGVPPGQLKKTPGQGHTPPGQQKKTPDASPATSSTPQPPGTAHAPPEPQNTHTSPGQVKTPPGLQKTKTPHGQGGGKP